MWPLSPNREEKLEPEPVAILDREGETHLRVVRLKTELNQLDSAMLNFKTTNRVTTDSFGRLLGIECATLNGRAAIESEWRALLKKRDALVSAWHTALHAWAEAKEQTK